MMENTTNRIEILEKAISCYKEYDSQKTAYIKTLHVTIENHEHKEALLRKEIRFLKGEVTKADDQMKKWKKSALKIHDDYEELLDTISSSKPTISDPYTKAIYAGFLDKIANLKKEIKKLNEVVKHLSAGSDKLLLEHITDLENINLSLRKENESLRKSNKVLRHGKKN